MTHKMDAFSMEDVLSVRSALRLRLKREALHAHLISTSANPPEKVAHGGLVAAMQLEQLFQRTVQFGENQSGLLLGAVGGDRRAIVLHAMHNLRNKFGNFTLVYPRSSVLPPPQIYL
ncbi:hypothetical protein DVH05_018590 [Phytophthora capsici]|nr:hypothetical protein DVH05_011417 [Phytophthora capsici]KAG1684315.1 hypothetical protein DVH05_011419 [Phytophthora capsici]KAG1696457.1 hypothetical protein DVH05_018588 [Phytophthora capsici]KAG1696459.1 hypothetical protein DVH05_018590 [Phytophthora capsici]